MRGREGGKTESVEINPLVSQAPCLHEATPASCVPGRAPSCLPCRRPGGARYPQISRPTQG